MDKDLLIEEDSDEDVMSPEEFALFLKQTVQSTKEKPSSRQYTLEEKPSSRQCTLEEEPVKEPTKEIPLEKQNYTNDFEYEEKKAKKYRYRMKYAKQPININPIELEENENEKKDPKDMSTQENFEYLSTKYGPKSFTEKVSGAISKINKVIFNPPKSIDEKDLTKEEKSNLNNTLSNKTIKQALHENIDLRILNVSGITATDFQKEGLYVSELQKLGITLQDVVYILKFPWKDICFKLKFNRALMTRESGWFDSNALSTSIVRGQGDIIRDLNFSIEDIFRLKCTDFEASKLQLDMDTLCSIGLNKIDFLKLPWYKETMVSVLGLTKEHLLEELMLKKKDFLFLFKKRNWNYSFLISELEFTESDLRKLGLQLRFNRTSTETQKSIISDPYDPFFDTIQESGNQEESEESEEKILLPVHNVYVPGPDELIMFENPDVYTDSSDNVDGSEGDDEDEFQLRLI